MEKWAKELPGCKTFLKNFFLTCGPYPVEINYLNYLRDIFLYAPTNRAIKENATVLMQAFYEIAGVDGRELERKVMEYFRSGSGTV